MSEQQQGLALEHPPTALADGWVIICVGTASPNPYHPTHCPFSGLFLKSYDPAKGMERWGQQKPWDREGPLFSWTDDIEQAMVFPDTMAAQRKWAEPITDANDVPVIRADGKLQRPLTGLTVAIEPIKDVKDEFDHDKAATAAN